MRNTLEYPVTKQEKIDLLRELISKYEQSDLDAPVGDMTGVILLEILKDITH